MKIKSSRLYPYPVLSAMYDDYINSSFNIRVKAFKKTKNLLLNINCDLNNNELLSLIDTNKAKIVCHFECQKTKLRYTKDLIVGENNFEIPNADINEQLQIVAFIVANENISGYYSKSFNPEYCIDKDGNNNSNMIANLPVFHRTPVNKYYSERIGDVYFAVWFVRIRERKYSSSPFDGVLKIEKILKNKTEIENGLDSELVDRITANIINERNPVCYGADRRWANHLYPIYVTESYLKSKYLGTNMFLNLF